MYPFVSTQLHTPHTPTQQQPQPTRSIEALGKLFLWTAYANDPNCVAIHDHSGGIIDMRQANQHNKMMLFPSISFCEAAIVYDRDSQQYLGFHVSPNSELNDIKEQVFRVTDMNHALHKADIVTLNNNRNHDNLRRALVSAAFLNVQLDTAQEIPCFTTTAYVSSQFRRNLVFIPAEKKLYVFDENSEFVASHLLFQHI